MTLCKMYLLKWNQLQISQKMKCHRKPSQRIAEILKGNAVSSNCPSDPKLTTGVQLPTPPPKIPEVLEGEGSAD
jgi:hypothetical protein